MVKPALVTIPVAMLLLVGAAYMWPTQAPGIVSNMPNLAAEPRHPVTPEMASKSEGTAGTKAAPIVLKDENGRPFSLADTLKSAPVVLVFNKDGCPCTLEAQTFFNQISLSRKAAKFVAVMDSDVAACSKFKDDLNVPYPILSAPDDTVFKSYGSKRSVYVTLVGKDGVIVRQWPGYSQAMLADLQHELETLTGEKTKPVNTEMAPINLSSGCELFMPVGN